MKVIDKLEKVFIDGAWWRKYTRSELKEYGHTVEALLIHSLRDNLRFGLSWTSVARHFNKNEIARLIDDNINRR